MADDLTQRSFRLSDRPERPKTSSGTDPLAELARLIGQTDPFGEFGRDQARTARVAEPAAPARAMPSGPNWNARPAPVPGYPPPRAEQRETDALHADNDAHEDAHERLAEDASIAPLEGDHDDFYEDEPRRRTGLIALAAVFALAVIGTAGALGYRALFGNSGAVPPVVIKADPKPIKVEAARSENTKPMQDRAPAIGERLIPREEKPVELKDKGPGTVLGTQVNPPPGAAPASGVVSTEPKKIHTIAIRPDGAIIEPSSAPPASAPPTAPVMTRVPAPPPRPPAAQPQQERVVEATPPRTAPLSLNPNGPAAPPAARVAPPSARPAPAAPPAAAPAAPVGATGYAVQISSQRSEAEAQAAYRSLQAKFPSQLGAHQPLIRRVELGEKGVYFRAMVGPFASSDEAIKLCTSLKSAGASCIVQKI